MLSMCNVKELALWHNCDRLSVFLANTSEHRCLS